MLLKLFFRDLILAKKIIFLYAALMTVAFVVFYKIYPVPGFALVYTYIWISMMPIAMASREDKFKTTVTTCSLPVTRNAIMLSRYLGAWLIIACGILYTIVMLLVFRAVGWSTEGMFTIRKLFDALTIFTLIIGVTMPFIMRFGMYGLIGLLVVAQVLLFFLLMLTKMFRGSITALFKAIEDFIAAVQGLQASVGYYPVILLILIAINLLSLGLSTSVFKRKEL